MYLVRDIKNLSLFLCFRQYVFKLVVGVIKYEEVDTGIDRSIKAKG